MKNKTTGGGKETMTTLAEYLKPKKKVRKCPYCKSKKGFELSYSISGNGQIKMTFTGKTIEADRETFDQMPHYVNCLGCGKSIDMERVKID